MPSQKKLKELHAIFEKYGEPPLYNSRMISGSKSMYRKRYPNNTVMFNANIVTKKYGKVWYGDLDITFDFDSLIVVAKKIKQDLYILFEMDARFENEDKPARELIKTAHIIIQQDGTIYKNITTELLWQKHQETEKTLKEKPTRKKK